MKTLFTAALLSSTVASAAFAQGETGSPAAKSGATFWVEHDVLTWASRTTEPDGQDKVKENSIQTTAEDISVAIFWNNFGIYVRPGTATEGNRAVGLSLFPQKEVELGVKLGLNHRKVDDDIDVKGEAIGIFGNYYFQLDSVSTLEFQGEFLYDKTKIEDTEVSAAGVESTTETTRKANSFTVGIQYDYQIAEHFHVLPGIFFNTGKATIDTAAGDDDTDITGLRINLAKFRYVF